MTEIYNEEQNIYIRDGIILCDIFDLALEITEDYG